MTVQDYAESMNYTVQDVLNKCKELGIKATQKDDMLDDEEELEDEEFDDENDLWGEKPNADKYDLWEE